MARHAKMEYWHKRQGKGAAPGAAARHASVKEGRAVPNPVPKLTAAQAFLQKLKMEIKRSANKQAVLF
jgi:hypothetical protein